MSTHTRSCHEAAISEALELVAIQIRPLLLLAPPVGPSGFGAVIGAVQIGGHNLTVVIDLPVEHGALCPRDPGVGNEDIQTAIELFDDFGDGFFDMLVIGYVDLVCLAWMQQLH